MKCFKQKIQFPERLLNRILGYSRHEKMTETMATER